MLLMSGVTLPGLRAVIQSYSFPVIKRNFNGLLLC
jgi:hypothetical protein